MYLNEGEIKKRKVQRVKCKDEVRNYVTECKHGRVFGEGQGEVYI